ncbi:Zn-ribbon domain-containing protein [Methanohalophilus sp.]|uniref:Zn-ribbon domain-containing protein n=1 Tax=Methanohalophilus sp. TaxID=1966352 RepID=UPI0026119CFF|nr:Zn-ribbon domain-containing protein [Methanohalophilus sp.]MDK2892095.1 uncharacterized protein [Methanohalophilus sp.]
MPHKCTRCGSIFEDGASIILNGCPNCGWNKFLYVMPENEKKQEVAEEQVKPEVSEEKKENAPSEDFIKEIDDLIGIERQERSVTEENGNRVESVRILAPGSYELNLDSLLNRKEIVMAIKEDGTYAVDLSSVFKGKKKKKG